jgi:hypothetical protein
LLQKNVVNLEKFPCGRPEVKQFDRRAVNDIAGGGVLIYKAAGTSLSPSSHHFSVHFDLTTQQRRIPSMN